MRHSFRVASPLLLTRLRGALILLLVVGPTAHAGSLDTSELLGIWTAQIDADALFSLSIGVTQHSDDSWTATVASHTSSDTVRAWRDGERIRFQPTSFPVAFNGTRRADGAIEGFLQHASYQIHLVLQPDSGGAHWSTTWNALGSAGDRLSIDLYVEREDSSVAGYLFFRDPTLPGCWTYGFSVENDVIRFSEKNMGLEFEGDANEARDEMQLTVTAIGGSLPIVFRRIEDAPDRQGTPRPPGNTTAWSAGPPQLGDGWRTGAAANAGFDTMRLDAMVQAIVARELTLTHSVLIARHGKLVFEEYFYGFNRDLWHDTRSASKTVAAALVGAAIDHKHLRSVEARVLPLLPQYRQLSNWDTRKAQITVEDLLRMASGLDANDSDDQSVAAEWRYQSQTAQPDWVKLALDAPMIDDPGAQPRYGSANPMIVGAVLQAVLPEPLELFTHRALFAPLGVQHYKLFLDPLDNVYLGGGMHLRPRDLAKFGQLHLDDGKWNGRRVLDAAWVRQSMAKRGHLANARDKNEYGYLWWHRDYTVDGKKYASIEARGAGGQYICVVPELDMVAIINSGNYRNGRFRQPEDIMEHYIVPAAAR